MAATLKSVAPVRGPSRSEVTAPGSLERPLQPNSNSEHVCANPRPFVQRSPVYIPMIHPAWTGSESTVGVQAPPATLVSFCRSSVGETRRVGEVSCQLDHCHTSLLRCYNLLSTRTHYPLSKAEKPWSTLNETFAETSHISEFLNAYPSFLLENTKLMSPFCQHTATSHLQTLFAHPYSPSSTYTLSPLPGGAKRSQDRRGSAHGDRSQV